MSVSIGETGSAAPSQKRLKAELTNWLAELDPDQVLAGYEHHKVPLPTHTWQEVGWSVSFTAIPRSPGKRGGPSTRAIGVYPAMAWFNARSDLVLHAVNKKGKKYGELSLPFIVAVGHAALFPEDEDIETALYGRSVEHTDTSGPSTVGRMPDGYWTTPRDHGHGRVSGVLVVDNSAPWTWTKNTPVLWRSPDPTSIPAPVLPTWATVQLVGDQVERQSPSAPAHTAVGLTEHWPTGDAFQGQPTRGDYAPKLVNEARRQLLSGHGDGDPRSTVQPTKASLRARSRSVWRPGNLVNSSTAWRGQQEVIFMLKLITADKNAPRGAPPAARWA